MSTQIHVPLNQIPGTTVQIFQPTMNLRWFIPLNKDYLPFLQQQWVCMQDGSTEWKKVERVEEAPE